MADLLFDTPYWLLGLLVLLGVGLFISGNSRQEARVRTAGLGAIALAVLLVLLSYFIDTDKEKVAKQTRELVTAVQKRDRATLDRLLHPRASMLWMTKPDIIDKAVWAADQYHLDNIGVSSIDTTQPNPTEIETQITVSTHVEFGGYSGEASNRRESRRICEHHRKNICGHEPCESDSRNATPGPADGERNAAKCAHEAAPQLGEEDGAGCRGGPAGGDQSPDHYR